MTRLSAWSANLSCGLALALAACATPGADSAEPQTARRTAEFQTEVESAELLGHLIFDQDTAAWVATDALLADKEYAELIGADIRGWVSYEDGDAYETAFVGLRDDEPSALFRVRSRGRQVLAEERLPDGSALTAIEALRWRARTAIMDQSIERCNDFPSINTAVVPIPGDPEGKLYGYIFSATRVPNLVVLGKHYRFTVSPDGNDVLQKRDFSKTCIAVANQPENNAGALFITHIMTPYPEEHHVFASLAHDVPIYVGTSDENVWQVQDGRIERTKK
ncbi:hypothetical protein [Parvularcula dongshanensis]|uniref:Lipoprotein n=1 Tax=Parvularcula dongshanensis TaxID=1173995 RepID=A0A840I4B7_9PROT|nr:hypothetical protein [Parvularcula dongshanensis]MBB4658870.1 hypothetical protein [Parvularcula dongshanensis]